MMTYRSIRTVLLAAVWALTPVAVSAQVSGRVTDEGAGSPVSNALVWLNGQTVHMTHTDSAGAYAFTGIPPGSYCLHVETPGYAGSRVCISVSAQARIIVDLPLTAQPLVIAPIVVESRRSLDEVRVATADSAQVAPLSQRLAVIGRRSTALAAAQLAELSSFGGREQSGGQRPHALYMWGSSAERGRVLLDGASLSAPLHLGALLPPVDPELIARAEVHTGGISPRYDGGTAYIMDFATRPAARTARFWGELDLLAARIGAESPINGRGRVIMSARRVNDEIIDGLTTSRFGYGYADLLARADLDIGSGGVHATAFATSELVDIPRDLDEDRASWNNRAAVLGWQNGGANVTLSASRGVADLPLLSAPGGHLEATFDRYRGVGERRWTTGTVQWSAGADVEHLSFRRRARASADPVTGAPGPIECTTELPCSHADATLASVFAEASLMPSPTVALSIGARTMYDSGDRRVHLLPRTTITFMPDARHSLTLSAGRFSQPYVREVASPTEHVAVDIPIGVEIARATHVELGVARQTDRFYLRGNTWLRHHTNVGSASHAFTVPGADLSLEYASRLGTFALAYSIAGSYGDRTDSTEAAPAQHLATAGFQTHAGIWDLSLTAAYGSGLPLTSIVLEHPGAPERYEPGSPPIGTLAEGAIATPGNDYLRLDASIGARFRIHRGDSGMLIEPYARIVNTLGERESLFYFRDASDLSGSPRALARLPGVPVVGVRWRF